MADELDSLKPYVSLILARVARGSGPKGVLDAVLAGIRDLLKVRRAAESQRELVDRMVEVQRGQLAVAMLRYRQRHVPAWLTLRDGETSLEDIYHQLVLGCRRGRYLAFHCSEPAAQQLLVRKLEARAGSFRSLEPIEAAVLNAAFVVGQAKTLWLTNLGRNVATKADSKVLAGISLQDALDPLGDQSYYFTAARVATDLLREPGAKQGGTIGSVPRRSRVWAGTTSSWGEFTRKVATILRHLETTEAQNRKEPAPLPVLAVPTTEFGALRDAFDVSLLPSELLSDSATVDTDALQKAERWGYGSHFEVLERDGPNVTARLSLEAKVIGDFRFEVHAGAPDSVGLRVEPRQRLTSDEALFREGERACNNSDWVKIRYESGHTFVQGSVFSVRHRDLPFLGWHFVDLSAYEVEKEKPTHADGRTFDPAAVGKQESLFCWISQVWPNFDGKGGRQGWLACDDGAGEIADFIHLDIPDRGTPLLTLIHVKASSSRADDRGISVSDYEVVSAQALKNLRFLDRTNLADRFEAGASRPVGSLVWKDGRALTGREQMTKVLRELGTNLARRVVVVQPRVTQTEYGAVRKLPRTGAPGPRLARMRQLDSLLLGVESDCRSLGAEFLVMGAR